MKFLFSKHRYKFVLIFIYVTVLSLFAIDSKLTKLHGGKFHHKMRRMQKNTNTTSNTTLSSFYKETYKQLNESFTKKDMYTFKTENNKWDYKLIGKQLDDIFEIFLYQNNKEITQRAMFGIMKLFIAQFEQCDTNDDNVIDFVEFKACVKDQKYFSLMNIDTGRIPAYQRTLIDENTQNTNITDTDSLSLLVFDILDEFDNEYLNFYDYMLLRVVAFSWRKCTNVGFFINEANFECTIPILCRQSLSRTTARSIFNLGMEFSNFQSTRHLDFVTFLIVGLDMRLYAKVNTKTDKDMTVAEMALALESNILPRRYDNHIIKTFFQLISNPDRPKDGLDLYSFIFMDYFLKLFRFEQPYGDNCITYELFVKLLNNYQFPKKIILEFFLVPQFNLDGTKYDLFITPNMTKAYQEQDFLLRKMRFLETEDLGRHHRKKYERSDSRGQLSDSSSHLSQSSSNSLKSRSSSKSSSSKSSSSGTSSRTSISQSAPTSSSTSSSSSTSTKSSSTTKNGVTNTNTETISTNSNNNTPNSDSNSNTSSTPTSATTSASPTTSDSTSDTSGQTYGSYFYVINPKAKFNYSFVSQLFYHLMNFPEKNCITIHDFLYFIQISYLYKEFDPVKLGSLEASYLYDKFSTYTMRPKISNKIHERVKMLLLLPKATKVNLYYTYALFRINDIVDPYVVRDYYGVLINEITLDLVLERMNIREFPKGLIKDCLKGYEKNRQDLQIPQYDWVCVVSKAVTAACEYLDAKKNLRIVQYNGIKLENTEFNIPT
jgi:hypothetical protein